MRAFVSETYHDKGIDSKRFRDILREDMACRRGSGRPWECGARVEARGLRVLLVPVMVCLHGMFTCRSSFADRLPNRPSDARIRTSRAAGSVEYW